MSILELVEERKRARGTGCSKSSHTASSSEPADDLITDGVELCEEPPPLPPTPAESRAAGLIELILKDQPRLHKLLRVLPLQTAYLPRLLGIALSGFLLYGLAMSLVLTVAHRWPELTAISQWLDPPTRPLMSFKTIDSHGGLSTGVLAPWSGGGALRLTVAYAFGLVAATGVCLPSLYFYCLLSGLRLQMVEIVVHAVKSKAVAAVALVGILPIYVAIALGAVIFQADSSMVNIILVLGLLLPLIAGLWGTTSIYNGFCALSDTMLPPSYALGIAGVGACEARRCFMRRLVLSWSACYLAVMPVMVYAIWQAIS